MRRHPGVILAVAAQLFSERLAYYRSGGPMPLDGVVPDHTTE
jgi:hypothetical protein